MSSKNKSSNTLNPESLELGRLREGIKALRVALDKVLDAVNAVCDEAAKPAKPAKQDKQDKQDKLTPGLHPVFKKSAQKAFQNLADSRKKAAEATKPRDPARKQAEKPTTDDQAGRPGNAAGTGAAPERQVMRTSASVRLTPHELTLNIGAQSIRELAVQDAKDLLNNPKVFWYLSTKFPDPRRYKVQPSVTHVHVVERKAAKFSHAPWTVSTTIAAVGDDKRCASWLTGVLARNRAEQE